VRTDGYKKQITKVQTVVRPNRRVALVNVRWFITKVQTREVYGPLSEQMYEELREELGVPEELVFTETVEP
jgi:hypothetical protein